MTYLEAAIQVLKDSGRAMSAEEITETSIARGFITPGGKTPSTAMRARLYVHARTQNAPLIRREYIMGNQRAVRRTVRWAYVG